MISEPPLHSLGLIGGMSWQSTQTYYARINQGVHKQRGGNHSAPLWLYSFNFAEIEALQAEGQWDQAGQRMADIARRLEDAGAQGLVICTNTMHKLSDYVTDATQIPLLHIVDATADAIKASGAQKPVLLATQYTMTQDFYRGPLAEKLTADNCGLYVPPPAARETVHNIIYHELCQGIIQPHSRQAYLDIIDDAVAGAGCDSVILGCTEIGLLIGKKDSNVPIFDTTALHCDMAIDFICGNSR